MSKKRLAEAHRQIGEAEHALEQQMLRQADTLPDPEHMRERARRISESADRHLAQAKRLSGDGSDATDEASPAQDPQDKP
ncbi:hypothetical protein [Modestobacter altitudinis]|uniref:hypothetical protein n=1 Tax=Modestobacter altitudinis TaxID=2213158 RepID=UPI00110CBF87|nr:hypothetical protein [Modestobacter altitudinis]